MAQLESENERQDVVPDDGTPKYMPSTDDSDPIVKALKTVLKCKEVTGESPISQQYPWLLVEKPCSAVVQGRAKVVPGDDSIILACTSSEFRKS